MATGPNLRKLDAAGAQAVLARVRALRAAASLPLVGGGGRSLLFLLVGGYQRYSPTRPIRCT